MSNGQETKTDLEATKQKNAEILKMDKGTWYGIAWINDINLDGFYRVKVKRYGGSGSGYSTIFEVLCIKGIRLKELNAQYFRPHFKGADIHIEFLEHDTENLKTLLER